ncbi:helix-turn-helix domain-containing protein [Lacisediminihabitans sp.]|uniref:helix-turn-helix domain-containing protein n=1 Tax=Lacisediminihabitans sp. TaxID=2787631 RepID=UPI0032C20E8A
MRSIAQVLHRSPSTISREVRRNGTKAGTCEPYASHRAAAERRPRRTTRDQPTALRTRAHVGGEPAARSHQPTGLQHRQGGRL